MQEAPKDVKRLEVLKPSSEPSMSERHNAAIAKEKRLEEVARPVQKKKAPEASITEALNDAKQSKKEESKKRKKAAGNSQADLANTEVLEEDDEVAEGIDWSDNESSGENSD